MAYSLIDRQAAVALVIEGNASGRPLAEIAADLGVAAITLRKWKRELRPHAKLRRGRPPAPAPLADDGKDEGELSAAEGAYLQALRDAFALALGVDPKRLDVSAEIKVCRRRLVIRDLVVTVDGNPLEPCSRRAVDDYVRHVNAV